MVCKSRPEKATKNSHPSKQVPVLYQAVQQAGYRGKRRDVQSSHHSLRIIYCLVYIRIATNGPVSASAMVKVMIVA